MKILIDTNVLISAIFSAQSTPYLAFEKAVTAPNQGVICEQNIDEARRVFRKKYPHKSVALETFLAWSAPSLTIIPMPVDEIEQEEKIRDVADRPLLRAAIKANVDIIITGDKDFLESGITNPKILTCAQFLANE